MTNDELTIAVAMRVMGWKTFVSHGNWLRGWHGIKDGSEHFLPLHNGYATSLEGAMLLVDELLKRGWEVSLTAIPGNVWGCILSHDGKGEAAIGRGDTLPRALCIAALDAYSEV